MSRVERLRVYAEGSTVDQRLADEVMGHQPDHGYRRLRALVLRAVRTAMLIELMEVRAMVVESIGKDGDFNGAEALTALAYLLERREEQYRPWVAEAEEGTG